MSSLAARLRALPGRTPLRVRLVAALLSLVTLALLVTSIAATAALRQYLVERVDAQLLSVARPAGLAADAFPRMLGRGAERLPRSLAGLPEAALIQLSDANGIVIDQVAPAGASARPRLPQLDAAAAVERRGLPFAVPGEDGGSDWRVLVMPARGGSRTVTVAVSLAEVDATVGRMILVNLVVGLAALVVLGLLGYVLVRSSLRPLRQVETTAAAIAAGDLSRRAPERDPRTEVGRLGRTFNAMVARIEAAFRAQAASEAAARASEDRMRRFVADASHELRTPLTSIRGYAELYRQGAVTEPAELARVMGRLEAEGTRMGLLVDDLLLLARLDQQRPLERRPVDLVTLAAEAVADIRPVAGDRGVDLRVDGGPAPVVLGDEPRLRQVLSNLLTNAVTHTPDGTAVTVRVGTVTAAGGGPGRRALLEVADTGPGMSEPDAARAFERFYRADTSRSRTHGGTGLGLSIVAALVEAHGGTVGVDTAPGGGATFRITLPLAAGEPAPGGPAAGPPQTPSQP